MADMSDISGLASMLTTPDNQDLVQSLGSISADDEKLQKLKQQMMMAQHLRTAMPQGTIIPRGSVYVGPNALQSLGAAGQNAIGAYLGGKSLGDMSNIASNEQTQRTRIMQMLAAQLRNQQAPGGVSDESTGPPSGVDISQGP